MTAKPFYTVEIGLVRPGGDAADYEGAYGAMPYGALAMDSTSPETSGTLRASDHGYRTQATDPDGIVVYPPILVDAFQIDRGVALAPGDNAVAWSFGAVRLADRDGQIASLMQTWTVDAQTVVIRRGEMALEDFQGYRSNRQSKGWYFDVGMVLQEAPVKTVRWDYRTGVATMLDEAAATNRIANPRAEGTVAGTPGTAPTGWTVTSTTSSVTRTIVGVGTENGIPYIDIRYAGTPSASFNISVQFIGTNVCAAAVGQTWTASVYIKLQAGALTNVTNVGLRITEAGGSSPPLTIQSITPTGAALSGQRHVVSRTISVSDTQYVWCRYFCSVTSGSAVDFTLRFAGAQLELGATATSLILPPVGSPAVTTRDADKLYTARQIYISPPYGDLDTIFTGMAGHWSADEGGVTVPLRDASYWMEQPAQGAAYDGQGSYGGPASLAGVPLPMVRCAGTGIARNVTPQLVDATNRIYQFTDQRGTVVALYERGAETITFAGDAADLYVNSTPAGRYRTDEARGLLQLGSPAAGQITVDVTGDFPLDGGWPVAPGTLAELAYYMLKLDVGVPTEFIDAASFSAAGVAYSYDGAVYIEPDARIDGLAAVSRALAAFGAKLVPTRSGQLRCLVLRAVSDDEPVVASLDGSKIIDVTPVPAPQSLVPPPYRVRVGYQRNNTIQTDLSVLATDDQRQRVATASGQSIYVNSTTAAAYRRPNDLAPIGGDLEQSADADEVAGDLGVLLTGGMRLFRVTVPQSVGMALDLGDVIQLRHPIDLLSAGARGRIVGEQFRSNEPIAFVVLV